MGQFDMCETVRAMTSTTARATIPTTQNGTVALSQVLYGECERGARIGWLVLRS